MNRRELMEKANEMGFTILIRLPVKREVPGKIAGYKLDFPMAYNNSENIEFQITWNMVERMVRGDFKQIIF